MKVNGYYDYYNDEFKESCKDVLRFERRIRGAKNLRKALHLPKGQKVTLQTVFDCEYDILREKIEEHFNISEIGEF